MAEFELKALITAKDRLSPQLTKLQKNLSTFRRNVAQASRGALGITAGLTAGATVALRAFARQEDAAMGLKVAMMQAQGQVGKHFGHINALALTLGDTLPGTTADFQQMMQMLVRQGISAERILNGVGQASAYLAVQLKKTPEAAAEFAAKLQDATGTTAKDLMGLFDTIQRAFYLGVDDTNLLSFFTKTSSVLKMVHQDGLKAAQGLAPISVMMDQMGMKGESAGNAVRKMIQAGLDLKKVRRMNHKLQRLGIRLDFTDGRGGFGGIDHLFTQLDKLKQLTDVQRSVVIKGIFGEDAETGQVVNALLDKGRSGYDDIVQKMCVQASLNQRVTAQLGTLKNLWEAMTGTATNGLASIGAVFSGDITPLIEGLGDLSARFNTWVQTHPHVIRSLVGMVAGFTAVKLAILGVNLATWPSN